MSWTVLRSTYQRHRTAMFWFTAGLVFYSWLMVWFYPAFSGGQYDEIVESLPPEVMAIFGADLDFASLGGFMQTEYLGLMWMLIVSSAAIVFAVRAFAGEIASGTMEFTLAQPVSRVRLAITRVVALIGYSLLLSAATFVPIQLFGPAYEVELGAEVFWTLFAFGTLFILLVGGIAMLISSMLRDGGRAGAIAAGLLVVLWIADLVSNFSELAEAFDPVNPVGYWQPGKIINGETLAAEGWWLYGVIVVVTLVGSVIVFSRRDVA